MCYARIVTDTLSKTSMSDRASRLALKGRLPRAWPAFFERHGNFTTVQMLALPALLDGANVIICAATASGKTEAAVAPLIERHCPPAERAAGPRILYLTPTRALANDLLARLAHPLQSLGISFAIKTSDKSTFRPTRPPEVLITTPESLDSLLAAHAKLLAQVHAIVVDEIHLLHGASRGDQLRVLLNRVRRVRDYASEQGDAPDRSLQYAALSATVADPAAVAAHYFPDARVIQVPGLRAWEVEWTPLAAEAGGDDFIAYLETFRKKGWRKALAFCNSRAEVEAYAAATRARSPFGDAVYVHYSNIEPRRRREVEQEFARAPAAICFASNTLELGIDIGDVDIVLLIGPPGSVGSFVQRIGRGNRRRQVTRVACCYRTPLERLIFAALSTARDTATPGLSAPFHPSVAIQQIFSLIKQSPTAAIRPAELAELFAGMLSFDDLQSLLAQLRRLRYLQPGRPGEWRAGERLNKLFDEQATAQPSLSIFSNIDAGQNFLVDLRDQHTGTVIARVDAQLLDRPVLTVEGRPVNVDWWDGEALWVTSYRGEDVARQLTYRSARQLLSYELARLLPAQLGLSTGDAPYLLTPEGWYWFHWLGDLYGRALLDLLRYHVSAKETANAGLCLELPDEPRAVPALTEAQVTKYLEDNYRRLEPLLPLGPFHHLVPPELRRRAVVEQFDVARFLAAVTALRPLRAPETLAADLLQLMSEHPA